MAKRKKRLTLLETTVELLRHRDASISIEEVAQKTDCTAWFLYSLLSSNPPQRPGVNAIQRLYEFLSNNDLQY